MRVQFKGINSVPKTLASGKRVIYYYAWKGGPRLEGRPGSPEFIASFNAAVATIKRKPSGTLVSILDAYESSSDFLALAARSQTDYKKHLRAIASEFGDFPIAALDDRRTRGDFLAWRDRLALISKRNADYRFSVFARALSWAADDRGMIALNPLKRVGRVYSGSRRDFVWSDDDEAAFYAKAPAHLHLALTLALWTGQRQGDILRMTWAAYDGQQIKVRQEKTAKRLAIPVGEPLRLALEKASKSRKDAVTILTTENGRAWTGDGFRTSWGKACKHAGIANVQFRDLRGTAITRMAQAGCSVPEIASVTGHSLDDVGAMLDRHYLSRDASLADSAIRKVETRTKTPNRTPNR